MTPPAAIGNRLLAALPASDFDLLKPELEVIADETLRDYAARKGIFLLSKPFTANRLLDTVELALGESIGRN